MSIVVKAIYEAGMLRPLEPLSLKEHQKVQIEILPDLPTVKTENALQELIDVGLLTPPRNDSTVPPIMEEERLRVATVLGQAVVKPLSEIIIEERGE